MSSVRSPFRPLEVLPERRAHLLQFMPLVRFAIPRDELPNYEYRRFIEDLLAEFVEQADARNAREAEYMRMRGHRWNEESGIGCLYIGGEYLIHSKMYLYDGDKESISPLSNDKPWRGIMFRDHAEQDCRFANLIKVFGLADEFEQFLLKRKIEFERHNMRAR